MRRFDKKSSTTSTLTLEPHSKENDSGISNSEAQLLRQKVHRLELVSELLDICNSTSNLNELMDKVFKAVIQDVGAEAGSLWLINEDRTELSCHVAEGPTRDKIIGLKLPNGSGIVGYVIDTCECRTVFDASKDAQFANSIDQKTGFTTRSMICAPLIVENTAIGALQLLNKKTVDGKFDADDLSLLRMLCQSSATPIVNARLRTSEQKVQELSSLLEISKEITGTLDLNSCLMSVVNLCSKLIPYDRAVIALNEKETIKISAISGQMKIDLKDPDIANLHTMLEQVSYKKEDVYIPSCKKYSKSENKSMNIDSFIKRYHPGTLAIYRLYDEESDLGLFMMEAKKENLISGSQFDRVAILKNMLTVALRNAQLYNSVPSLSIFKPSLKDKKFSVKKISLITLFIVAVGFALWAIKLPYQIKGKFEIQPQRKYIIYSSLDNALIAKITSDPSKPVQKGDTLLHIDNIKLKQDLINKKNDIQILRQKLSLLKQQSKYSEYHTKRLELKKAELEAASLNRKIKDSYVISPVNGCIINDEINNLTGRRFNKGDELFEIIKTGNTQLKLEIVESDINRIKKGQICKFRVPAFPGKTFEGEVLQVAYDVKNEDKVYYPVLVRILNAPPTLLPGMSGQGKIETEKQSLLTSLLSKPREYIAIKLWL